MDGGTHQEPLARGHHFISNLWVEAAGGATLPAIDPSTGRSYGNIARGNADDVALAVAAAREAYGEHGEGPWGRMPAAERGRRLQQLSQAVALHAEPLAQLESRATGKPLSQARADAHALARYLEYYAGAADKLHGDTIPYQPGMTVFTLREPHGVTGHLIPWNYPLQIFGRSVGAALAAGNACVVKPAEDACVSLLKVAKLAAECDLPDGVLNIVTGLGAEAGQALTAHPDVDHISFTGSPTTGTRVAQAAAAHHAPVTLELGGKSPQIVFDDADLDAAAPVIVAALVQNAGQTCSAGSRVLIQRAAYAPLLARLASLFERLRAGAGAQDLDLGPLIRAGQRDRVLDYLEQARRDSLRIAASGSIDAAAPAGGFYVAPTLLADVPPLHAVAQEEIFGPVLAAMAFDDEADAIRLANGTAYGLAAGVWTSDGARQFRLARALKCGQVFVNNYGAGGGVELPFGGRGASGYGREKGFEALYGFTALKTVAVRHG